MTTIAELQAYIYDWAKRKGWWEPQCNHQDSIYISGIHDGTTAWCTKCGACYFDHEWHLSSISSERNVGELHALFHTEISESFEEVRNHHPVTEIYYSTNPIIELSAAEMNADVVTIDPKDLHVRPQKPEGVPIELADLVIRILDFCGHFGINLEEAINIKMAYNETRPYRHGGKAS